MKKGGIAAHNLYPLGVIAGLVPAIQFSGNMDHRDKPGGDDGTKA